MPTNAKTFVIGKVRPTFEGVWDAGKTYQALALVSHRGEAYMAQQDVPVNREPDVSTDYWVKVGGKGDKGDTGPAGPQGVGGRDGAPGIQGPQGVGPKHRWAGTTLSFENPDGTWATPTDLKGPQGIQGPEGPIGPQGIQGPVGQQGPRGEIGPRGPAGPLPALSSSVTSSSTTTAASSYAVKLAYDKAPVKPRQSFYNDLGCWKSYRYTGENPLEEMMLPPGGEWAYTRTTYQGGGHNIPITMIHTDSNVAAGGMSLGRFPPYASFVDIFCWRIA